MKHKITEGRNGMIQFLQEAAHVVPSKRQLDWYELESYAFIHFGVNTFTNREWGEGTEPESIFNPENLDCDQWVEAIKAAGMKGMVLTATRRFLPLAFQIYGAFREKQPVQKRRCPGSCRSM